MPSDCNHTKKIINMGFMAHVDAGKTTLTEQLLFRTGQIRSTGSVDAGTAHTDFLSVERRRGISVRAAVTTLETECSIINLIDTPGHVDFSAETERALMVLDAVVLVISAVEGIQAQTETIWRALKKRNLPTILFINKLDRIGSDFNGVMRQVKKLMTLDAGPLYQPSDEGRQSVSICKTDWIELAASLDEESFNRYMSGTALESEAFETIGTLMRKCAVYPVLCGSAMYSLGTDELLDAIENLFPDASLLPESTDLSGIVFKIEHHPVMGKIAHTRLYSGSLSNRDQVPLMGKESIYKATQIRKYHGEKHRDAGRLQAGDIAGICGLTEAEVGDIIGTDIHVPKKVSWVVPLLRVSVKPNDDKDLMALSQALSILNDEDPCLEFMDRRESGEFLLSITGVIQIEVLTEILKDRFALTVTFGHPMVIYKETPAQAAEGFDAYTMPKPCWAVLRFRIEPGPLGSGLVYKSEVLPKNLPYRYQNHVETAVPRSIKQGLKGWEVTDLTVTLIEGGYHEVHTHPLDFFVATPMAIMNGLFKAGARLLEPVLSYRIEVDEDLGGKIIGEVLNMRGSFDSPTVENGRFIITGLFPVATSMDFPVKLASMTSGKGILSTWFHSYHPCPPDVDASIPRTGVNPLDRSKFILWARNALVQA